MIRHEEESVLEGAALFTIMNDIIPIIVEGVRTLVAAIQSRTSKLRPLARLATRGYHRRSNLTQNKLKGTSLGLQVHVFVSLASVSSRV